MLERLSQNAKALDEFFEHYIGYFDSLCSSNIDAEQKHAQHLITTISETARALKKEEEKLVKMEKRCETSVNLVGNLILFPSARYLHGVSFST